MVVTAVATLLLEAVGWVRLDTRAAQRGGLHLPGRPVLVRRRIAGRCGRNAVAGVVEIGRTGRRLHLGHDGACRRFRRRRGDRRGLGCRREIGRCSSVVNLVGIVGGGPRAGASPDGHTHTARGPDLAELQASCAMRTSYRCDGIVLWASRWRWSIAPATRSTDWWRYIRTSSGCARRRTRALRSRPTR